MNLDGKVALVTGSGRGIGKAIAQRLSEAGATVVINDVSDAAEATAEEIKASGKQSLFIKGSISSSTDVNQMVDRISSTFNRLDILVNNAGISRDQLTIRMTDEEWDAVLDVNLKGSFPVYPGGPKNDDETALGQNY